MVELVYDPTGLFRTGATFRNLDWAISAGGDVWPNGSRWSWRGRKGDHQVRIIAGIAIREDGAQLKSKSGSYEWQD